MVSLTIRNIDKDLKRKLEIRAANSGRSMEQDLRLASQALVAEEPQPLYRSEAEAKVIYEQLRALARPPLEPFDQKAVSDELYDYLP